MDDAKPTFILIYEFMTVTATTVFIFRNGQLFGNFCLRKPTLLATFLRRGVVAVPRNSLFSTDGTTTVQRSEEEREMTDAGMQGARPGRARQLAS